MAAGNRNMMMGFVLLIVGTSACLLASMYIVQVFQGIKAKIPLSIQSKAFIEETSPKYPSDVTREKDPGSILRVQDLNPVNNLYDATQSTAPTVVVPRATQDPSPTGNITATIPPSLRHLIPQQSEFDDYLKLAGFDNPGVGDVSSRGNTSVENGIRIFNELGSRCMGFAHSKTSGIGSAYFKDVLHYPKPSSSLDLYIKKSLNHVYMQGLLFNLTCAVPLKNFHRLSDSGCKLPKLNPFHKDVLRFSERRPPINCTGSVYTELENRVLRILDDAKNGMKWENRMRYNKQIERIDVTPIHRKTDFRIELGNKTTLWPQARSNRTSVHVKEEFWTAVTHFTNGTTHKHVHACVVEKPDVSRRPIGDTKYDMPLDIMIIIFDGTSNAHFQRMLPESYAFLTDEMNSTIFKGFSIVGDATTPNVAALLTGRSEEENLKLFGEGRRGYPNSSTIDSWPFIFKDLKERGFATFYGEDDPYIGGFHLRMYGFKNPPADHFGRAFWQHRVGGLCINSEPQVTVHLNYLKSFMKAYTGRRKFGVVHLSDLCHRELTLLSIEDKEIVKYLRSLKEENLLNETMFIMMGDHGARFGEIRGKLQGKLEERLPMMSVTLPSWFKERYADKFENFKQNTGIITSHLDFHATFLHLSSFNDHPPTWNQSHGSSLFKRLPRSRTCAQAGIPELYCPCLIYMALSQRLSHAR